MENFENNNYDYEEIETKSLKDYLHLIRNNLLPVVIIVVTCFAAAVIYAVNSQDIYKSSATLRISKQQGNILQSPMLPEVQDYGSDRFIANEIEIINSFKTRERVAKALIDSFQNDKNGSKDFNLILNKDDDKNKTQLKSVVQIANLLAGQVSADQKKGLDMIEITAQSPSPYEAALIANTVCEQYKAINLEVNRNQLTFVKNFLEKQTDSKKNELRKAEDNLKNFQEKGGIIALDEQATAMINQLSQFEAQQNAAKIDIMASNEVLTQYKAELKKQDPQVANYLESLTSEAYITALQQQIAELQLNRDIALANKNTNIDITAKVNELNKKIDDLKGKLTEKINDIKAGIFASSRDDIKELSQKIIDEEVRNSSLKMQLKGLQDVVHKYDAKFNKLPKTSLELARLKRNRESLEQLYTLLEQKYQESIINELSQPGNVLVVDDARVPNYPAKPNRLLIILVGLAFGVALAFGFVLVKDYFNNTVKTPEDIQRKNVNVLAWIPRAESLNINGNKQLEFIVLKKPDAAVSEAFRALRTRVQFSKVDADSFKTILVTSPAPQEGKTFVSVNLAGSFAIGDKKVLLIDADLRKPRIHSIMNADKTPGVVDYLFNKVKLEDIVRNTEIKNLDYIASGTIPPNPAEVLESKAMKSFLSDMSKKYDVIILDSAPIIAVTDSEILSRMVDGTLLVISSDKTEIDLMENAVALIKNDKAPFLGTVLNNFGFKNGYGSYYKYYYYYSQNGESRRKSRV